ncbi:TEX264 (predicted), partial [Pycnogonum litorale]
ALDCSPTTLDFRNNQIRTVFSKMDSESLMLLAVFTLLIILFLTIFILVIYSGLFTEIVIKTCKPPFASLEVAYKYSRGVYKNCSILFTEVHALAPSLKNYGIYYDDPDKVKQNDLRYIVGAVLSDGENPDLTADDEVRQKLLEHGYKIQSFPVVENVVMTSFPFKSMVSVMIAISRVYPRLKNYIEEHKLCAYPIIEIYESNQIIFCMPLSKQDEFFVEEANDEGSLENDDNDAHQVTEDDEEQSGVESSVSDDQSKDDVSDDQPTAEMPDAGSNIESEAESQSKPSSQNESAAIGESETSTPVENLGIKPETGNVERTSTVENVEKKVDSRLEAAQKPDVDRPVSSDSSTTKVPSGDASSVQPEQVQDVLTDQPNEDESNKISEAENIDRDGSPSSHSERSSASTPSEANNTAAGQSNRSSRASSFEEIRDDEIPQ